MSNVNKLWWLLVALIGAACASESGDPVIDDLAAIAPPAPELGGGVDGKADDVSYSCPGVWDDGLPDARLVKGYYQGSFLGVDDGLLALNLMTEVSPSPETIAARGDYLATMRVNGLVTVASGRYVAAPNNPAIGAVVALHRTEKDVDFWWVIGSRRSRLTGTISALCLLGAVSGGTDPGHAVALTRLGL